MLLTAGELQKGDIGYVYAKTLNLYTDKKLKKKGITASQGEHLRVEDIDDKSGITKVTNRDKDAKTPYYIKTSTLKAYLMGYDTGGYTGE